MNVDVMEGMPLIDGSSELNYLEIGRSARPRLLDNRTTAMPLTLSLNDFQVQSESSSRSGNITRSPGRTSQQTRHAQRQGEHNKLERRSASSDTISRIYIHISIDYSKLLRQGKSKQSVA